MKRRFIVVLKNQQRFDAEEYGKETTVVSESRLTWFPINSSARQEFSNNVEMTELELQDFKLMQIGHITEFETQIFSVSESKTRPYEYPDNVHLSISYEFKLDLYRVERDVYNFLDLLGDIGGLRDALFIIGFCVLFMQTVIRGNMLESWLIESYFSKPSKKPKEGGLDLHSKIHHVKIARPIS